MIGLPVKRPGEVLESIPPRRGRGRPRRAPLSTVPSTLRPILPRMPSTPSPHLAQSPPMLRPSPSPSRPVTIQSRPPASQSRQIRLAAILSQLR